MNIVDFMKIVGSNSVDFLAPHQLGDDRPVWWLMRYGNETVFENVSKKSVQFETVSITKEHIAT